MGKVTSINTYIKEWAGILSLLFGSGILFAALKFAYHYGGVQVELSTYRSNVQQIPTLSQQVTSVQRNADQIPNINNRLLAVGRSLDGQVIPRLNELSRPGNLAPVPPANIEAIRAVLQEERKLLIETVSQSIQKQQASLDQLDARVRQVSDRVLEQKVNETINRHLWMTDVKSGIAMDPQKNFFRDWYYVTPDEARTIRNAGLAFSVPVRPVNAQVQRGIVVLEGTVASPSVKKDIEDAIQKLGPQSIKNDLQVKPQEPRQQIAPPVPPK